MDRSNRRKITNSKRSNPQNKNGQEMNGNTPSGAIYKVENVRRQKQRREFYKPENQGPGRMSDGFTNYLPLHGQRLFAAVSDPAVCGYPVSLGYPYDPIPVSLGYPIYQQPPPYAHRVPCKDTNPPRRTRPRRNDDKITQSKDTFQTVDEYTSLPPGNLQDIESDQQRRFSDPGLANNTDSEGDSLSNDGSSASWYDDSQVSGQIEILLQENKRLSKELKETQTELQELKSEVASLVQMQASCEPGFVTDLVREVHEATKLREETLLAKLRAYSENFRQIKLPPSEQLSGEKLDREELTQRLANLEEQMKTILAHNSVQETTKEELLEAKKEKLMLQQELKSSEEARNTAEASVLKYERLLNSLSKRLPNGLVLEDKGAPTATASLDTSESLSSSLGSGSLHSPQVTMSGPVTDL